MPSERVLLLEVCLCFLIALCPARGDRAWESSVGRLTERDVKEDDPAYMIRNLQEYYKGLYDDSWPVENSADSTVQETNSGTVERLAPGRYAVVFRQDTSDDVIERTISLLKDAHHRTSGKITANHFDKIEHAAKGFFATLSKNLVSAVSDQAHEYW